MIAYKYRAISKDGSTVDGVVNAYDEFEAAAEIKKGCSVILNIEQVEEKKRNAIDITEPTSISEKILSLISSQFSILIKAGIPTAKAVSQIASQTTDKYMKDILEKVSEDVNAGYGLAQSFETRSTKLPATFIETVRAGEMSGTLDKSFDKLARYYDRSSKLREKVKSALTYPAILVVLTIVVVIVVVKVAVPTISQVILDGGGEIPAPTKVLLGIYDFFAKYSLIVLAFIALIIIAGILYKKTSEGVVFFSKVALKMPVLGHVNIMNSASQFANTMSTLLSSGLTLNNSLVITSKVLDNNVIGSGVERCALGVEEGRKFGEVLNEAVPEMPGLLIEMAAAGEGSGKLEETLDTIGRYYDSETEQAATKAIAMLEPMLTIFLGIIIGFIVIALYLPMFTMYNGM